MQTTYDFLDALELDDSAQERDIRRAYARKLKRIDQATEAAAFQALRDAYEAALDWARWNLAQAAGETEPAGAAVAQQAPAPAPLAEPPQAATPREALPDAAQLGRDVFGRFQQAAGELLASGKHGDPLAWQAAIEARFADEELVNIDARIYFEAGVAALLASSWRPGHEALFVAANDAFAWTGDRRRLWQLGQAGRMLDQAIEERQLYEALPTAERSRMRDLLKLLRQDGLPSIRRIRAAMEDVERMLVRFPAFVPIVASMENMERWRSQYRESGGAPIAVDVHETPPAPAEPARRFSAWQGILIFLALAALLRALFNFAGGEQDAGRGFIPPVTREAPAVPQAVLDRVVPPVAYTAPPGTDAGKLEVIYKVYLSVDRKVERVQNWQTSGEPGFDQAVGDALAAAKDFPPETPREFQVRYTGRMTRTGPPRPAAAGQSMRAPAAPVTQAMLDKHIPAVRFTPTRYAREGKYTVVYRVLLDHRGKVANVELLTSSGDIRLDKAVEEALRAAKPFTPGTPGFTFTYSGTLTRKPAPDEPKPAPALDG